MSKFQKTDVYKKITDQIISQLEAGTVPWHKPWNSGNGDHPRNLFTGREYSGINIFLLLMAGYPQPFYATFNQIREHGGQVVKGSHGQTVVFWRFLDRCTTCGAVLKKDVCPKCRRSRSELKSAGVLEITPILKQYTVFNIDQTTGLEKYAPQPVAAGPKVQPIKAAEKIVASMPNKPVVKTGYSRAFYTPATDQVSVPALDQYNKKEEYYSTLFHELVHSTGHESRLNRKVRNMFGDENYSKEELVAEMGAAFLCADAHISERTVDNSAAYIQGWLKSLKNDKKMVIFAAAQANKAAAFITNKSDDKIKVAA